MKKNILTRQFQLIKTPAKFSPSPYILCRVLRLSRVTRTGLNESLATRMTTIVSLHVNAYVVVSITIKQFELIIPPFSSDAKAAHNRRTGKCVNRWWGILCGTKRNGNSIKCGTRKYKTRNGSNFVINVILFHVNPCTCNSGLA